jgi:hypothetical protein
LANALKEQRVVNKHAILAFPKNAGDLQPGAGNCPAHSGGDGDALLLLENRPPGCFRSKSAAPSDLLVDKRLRNLQQPYSDQQQGRDNLTRINSMAVGFPGAKVRHRLRRREQGSFLHRAEDRLRF